MNNILINAHYFPHIGQRMLKTAFAVFVCLIIYRALGFQGATMPAEGAITAIICLQPHLSDSRTFARNRFTGSIIGTVWGMLFLILMYAKPSLGQHVVLLYGLMAVGVLASVYTSVAIKVSEVSSLSAIVFICIVVQFPDIGSPFLEGGKRFLGIMIGTFAAILVNNLHLPRGKREHCLIFIKSSDLIPDRFTPVSPSIMFHINRLYEDGAQICLMLEHAPALFTLQMSRCQLNVPLIVMDGAALYDINANRYMAVQYIETDHALWLQSWLHERQINFFTYIIRNNRTYIYHDGEMNELELHVLKQLQKSPYRSYLDGENLCPECMVYIKIIDRNEVLEKIQTNLLPALSGRPLRMVIREQASTPGISGLYIYSDTADFKQEQKRLLEILRIQDPDLQPVDLSSRFGYRSEHDASALLRQIKHVYEPVEIPIISDFISNIKKSSD